MTTAQGRGPRTGKTTSYSAPYSSSRGFGASFGGRRFSMFGNAKGMVTNSFGRPATASGGTGGGRGGGDDGDGLGGNYGAAGSGLQGQENFYKSGTYGFRGFYANRSQLGGINSGFDWRKPDLPGVERGYGALFEETKPSAKEPPEAPRDWGPRQESHDISGVGPTRPMDRPSASPWGIDGGPSGSGPRSHNLYNARTREAAGSGVVRAGAASPGQQFAGYSGGTWPGGQIGSQSAVGSGQTSLRPAYPSAIDTSSSG